MFNTTLIAGGNIILAVRNAEKGKRAIEYIKTLTPAANVVIKLLDVSEFSSIRDFADQIKKEYNKIDVLINNAGIIFHPYKKTSDGNELTFVTNYLGKILDYLFFISFIARYHNLKQSHD